MEQKQYNQFKQIAIKITKNSELSEDLLHDVILQLNNNEKFNTLSERDKVFFFVRTLTNNFYSNNSKFQRTYRKFSHDEIPDNYDPKDEEYVEPKTMDWIHETLDNELKNNKDFWYNHGIFKMYLEHKKIKAIHERTRIPIYSLRATIKEMKLWVQAKWKEYEKQSNRN